MIEITAEIRAFIDKAAAGVELAEDEYIDPSDGLIHCKKCGGQRQTVVPCFGKSGYFMPRCICQCQREAEEQRKAAEERQRRMERIKRRKAQGLHFQASGPPRARRSIPANTTATRIKATTSQRYSTATAPRFFSPPARIRTL